MFCKLGNPSRDVPAGLLPLCWLPHLGHRHTPFTSKLALATGSLGGAQATRVQNALAKGGAKPQPLPRAGTLSLRSTGGRSDEQRLAGMLG